MAQGLSGASFSRTLAEGAASGRKILLLAPLGTGKTHALRTAGDTLGALGVPFVFLDLFTAASTPERLLAILAAAVLPFAAPDREEIEALVAKSEGDRHLAGPALLSLLKLIAQRRPAWPQVFLIDEITEIRSLAYFPGLGSIETPFSEALHATRGVLATSSYLGLAADTVKDLDPTRFPGLTSADLDEGRGLRNESSLIEAAVELTRGAAASLLPLVEDLRDSRDLEKSLVRLLEAGGGIEVVSRRHYEVLLLRSRGYAVSKRAAEAVASTRDARLTDLFPAIGRTAGASRQYLRWLVEVGLLVQTRKRYDFADPILGLWASLYLGRGTTPTEAEIRAAVKACLAGQESITARREDAQSSPTKPAAAAFGDVPRKRVELLEEID